MKYTDPTGEWFITAFATIGGAYLGGMQANGYELNPGNWDWGSANTYYSIAKGGISGYGVGTSIESKISAFSDVQKIRSGEMPSLYEAMNSSTTYDSYRLLASNENFSISNPTPRYRRANLGAYNGDEQLAYSLSYLYHVGNPHDYSMNSMFDFQDANWLNSKQTGGLGALWSGKRGDMELSLFGGDRALPDDIWFFAPGGRSSHERSFRFHKINLIQSKFFPNRTTDYLGNSIKYPYSIQLFGKINIANSIRNSASSSSLGFIRFKNWSSFVKFSMNIYNVPPPSYWLQ